MLRSVMSDAIESPTPLALWFARSGYTQRAVATVLGITDGHMSSLVAGNRSPSLSLAIRISDLTGLPVQELVVERPKVA